ncbi:MAG: response regulator, partial [Myxococcales bacterium]
ARPSVDAMVGAARRLSRLVSDILDVGALQGGNVSLEIRSLDLAPTVQAQVSHTMLQLVGRPLRIESYLSEGEFLIRADEARVAQVLAALLSNAVKFSERGLIELQARNDGDFVELAVRDQGIGIPEEQLANVTRAFEQGDGGAGRRQGGTGLGLALAARLIEAQQGTLTVRSTVGVGTTVVVRLPASREAATNFRIPVASVAPEALEAPVVAKENPHEVLRISGLPMVEDGVSGSMALRRLAVRPGVVSTMPPPRRLSAGVGARVLVVDDDDLNRRVIQEHLRNSPFTVVEASDGKSALRTFDSQGPFDAVLLDVMMPGMTGYEVCRALRRQVGPTDVPVLMLTAKQQVSDLVEGFDAGANDYVLKPFSKAELLARLSAHVGVARAALAMRRFVPRETIQLLGHDDLAAVCLGDAVEQRLSIAFSDVRGFTAAVERMTPAEAFRWLNRCYGIVAPEIRRAGGFVDKYIGDAIMALFPRAPADAVRAAVAMHRGLESMAGIRLGTGVHLGPTMLGTLGEPERFEATVLSDAVNVAARIEGATKAFGCRALVSKAVFQGLPDPDEWSWRALGKVQLKGRAASIELFELLDADAEEERELKLRYRDELEAGIDAFRDDRLHEALLSFQHVAEENPLDGPALAYRLRTSQLLVSRGDFDGTFVLGEK